MDLIPDHAAQARARLLEQFKGQPLFEGLVDALASRVQDLESEFYALGTERGLDDAVGVQLDVIGRRLGQAREGMADETYRLWLRVRQLLNRCSGTVPELVAIFALLSGNTAIVREEHPAALSLLVLNELPFDSEMVAKVLQKAKSGGIRAILEWRESPEDETFGCRPAAALLAVANLAEETAAGSSTFVIADTSVLPTTGYVVIDSGMETEETLPYEVTGPNEFDVFANATFTHPAGSPVSVAPSNGLGDAVDLTVGGQMADALVSGE